MLSASISLYSLLLILVIVILLFGTKKLGNIGADLGNALKGFRKAIRDESAEKEANTVTEDKTLKDNSEHKK
jgi:sec-independent protein translocase protein TatA